MTKPFVLLLDDRRILGGGQRQILMLADGLGNANWRVAICCPPGSPLDTEARTAGLDVHNLPLHSQFDAWSVFALRRLAHRLGADIVHAHAPHSHGLMWFARLTGLRSICIAHRHIDTFIKRNPISRGKYRHGAHAIIAVSQGVRREVLKTGVDPAIVHVVNAVIDPTRITDPPPTDVRELFNLPADSLVCGTVGALKPYKGHRDLIDAWVRVRERFPNAVVLIMGDGELRGELEQRIHDRGLEGAVRLLGHRDDVGAILRDLDLFVLPSHHEGMPGVLLEAMLAERAVVCTDCAGSDEAIQVGRTGLITPRHDPEAFADAVCELLADPDRRQAMGKAAPPIVHAGFHPEHMVAGTIAVYEQLLAARND